MGIRPRFSLLLNLDFHGVWRRLLVKFDRCDTFLVAWPGIDLSHHLIDEDSTPFFNIPPFNTILIEFHGADNAFRKRLMKQAGCSMCWLAWNGVEYAGR